MLMLMLDDDAGDTHAWTWRKGSECSMVEAEGKELIKSKLF